MKHFSDKIQGWFDFKKFYRHLAEELPQNFRFAEIGVWRGKSLSYFAVSCIRRQKTGTIYAIDNWIGSREHQKTKNPYQRLLKGGLLFEDFLRNIQPIKQLLTIISKDSISASKDFEDGSLDAVFIDAGHDYYNVMQDLIHWYPKVKSKGILAGHDFARGKHAKDVQRAVDEFSKLKNLSLSPYLLTDVKKHVNPNIWIIYKP